MHQHVCDLCREEAIAERCPNFSYEEEWGPEDQLTVTNPDTPEAHMGVREVLDHIRRDWGWVSARSVA